MHDAFLRAGLAAVDFLRYCLVDRHGKNALTRFVAGFYVVLQYGKALEYPFCEHLIANIVERERKLGILIITIIVVLPKIAFLLRRNDLAHQVYGRVILARIPILSPFDYRLSQFVLA